MITVSIDPAAKQSFAVWQKDFMASLANSFGIPYELMSQDYVRMEILEAKRTKAFRLCSRAGHAAGNGKRGQRRKLKRAVRILKQVDGGRFSHSSVLMRYKWAFDAARRERFFDAIWEQWANENRFVVRPFKWKGA